MQFLSYQNYHNTKNIIIDHNATQQAMVEQNVLESLRYADSSYKILERYLNQEMGEFSGVMVDKYAQDPDITSWDLEQLKKQFTDYEIYIVDSNLEIIHTTFIQDLGLDFKQFPSFAELLWERMAGNEFNADRMDISTTTQRIKKYSYMPTPDNKYLLELSIDIAEKHPSMQDLNIFSHADNVTENNELVKMISFYKFNETGSEVGVVTKGEGPYIDVSIASEVKDVVKNAVLSNKSIKVPGDNYSKVSQTHNYIPYLNYTENGEFNWWNSYVVGITYDDSILQSRLLMERNLFIGKTALITFVFILFTLGMVYLLRRTEQLASCDSLTNLPNRKLFGEYFKKLTSQGRDVKENIRMAVLFIDLNNFKTLNDTFGHEVGDQVLKQVAHKLKSNLRKDDMVVRAGGDEFLVLLTGITSIEDANSAVLKIIEALTVSFVIDGKEIDIRASIGVSLYPDNGTTLRELMQKADVAMYKAKREKPDISNYVIH